MSEIVEKECKMEVDESCVANNGNGKWKAGRQGKGKRAGGLSRSLYCCCCCCCFPAVLEWIGFLVVYLWY